MVSKPSAQRYIRPEGFYCSPEWRAVRSLALKRDGYRCITCGNDVSGLGAARVDHIRTRKTHPHLALVLHNLRTLCPRCDNRAHPEKGGRGSNRPRPRFDRRIIQGVDRNGWPLTRNIGGGG